jgi:hypothetical protein
VHDFHHGVAWCFVELGVPEIFQTMRAQLRCSHVGSWETSWGSGQHR